MNESRVLDLDRLEAVERSGLVDSERETVFDELASLAAQLLDAPFAFVTAVDAERSFWKSAHGIADGARFNSVADSFCQYVIEGERELIVDDAANHPVTASNPSIDSMGVAAWAGYPVMLGDQILGTFCVVDQRPRVWTPRERAILRRITDAVNEEIARRTSDDGAEVLGRHQLEQLRAGLVQVTLPTIPGLDVAAWHRPAGGELVLGDFYDVFPLDHERWCVILGDVCGHGHLAAQLASFVRTELRESMQRLGDAAGAMAATNDELIHRSPDAGRFATGCVMVLEPRRDAVAIRMCSAGHPAVLVRRRDGSTIELPAPDGPPLGVTPAVTFTTREHALQPGTTMLAYTDGATECRDDHDQLLGDVEFARLFAAAAEEDRDAQGVIAHLSAALASHAAVHHDDIALVAVQHRA
ncbi:MAG: SpoIIE family protein phosphatase [Ilumatobacter sp.]|nr:SpoIIE family protein phosphatase [Ilumatobacter sp.]